MELPKETIERMIEEAKCYRPFPEQSKGRIFLTDMCEHYYQGKKSEALRSLSEIEKLKEEIKSIEYWQKEKEIEINSEAVSFAVAEAEESLRKELDATWKELFDEAKDSYLKNLNETIQISLRSKDKIKELEKDREKRISYELTLEDNNKELMEALRGIANSCDNQNPTHETIWRIADSLLKSLPK